jgi:hypothetical protein
MKRPAPVLGLLAAAAVMLSLASCAFDIPQGAFDYISSDQLRQLQSMGMTINQGMDPPDVTGSYVCDSLVRTGGNIPGDTANTFADLYLQLASQLADNSLVVSYDQPPYESGSGLGAFISGSGNKFTIYAQIDGVSGSVDFKDAMVFSGTMTSSGIEDFVYALLLTEKSPDPYQELIEVGQGRVITEDDGLAAFDIAARGLKALGQVSSSNSR